jgi:hypothetical protein
MSNFDSLGLLLFGQKEERYIYPSSYLSEQKEFYLSAEISHE